VPDPVRQAPARNAGPSIISADLKIVGDLTSAGDIQIDGSVEGDIHSRTVTIGEAAQVTGSITGDTVRICGSVNGQIKGQTVTLDKSAKVNGDIHHHSLAIEPGAFLEGHCRRIDSKPASIASVGSGASVSPAGTSPGEIKPASIANSPKQYVAS
jgi:cytoskeletal protein CcmA (bactofilin family)